MIWYPFTKMKDMPEPIEIARGEGAHLFDTNGNRYIDAISSWWVNLHGHAHPHIAAKVHEQMNTLEHVIMAGFIHKPARELCERLMKHLPDFARLFFSDDGSTAVEVALKMSLQYWYNKGEERTKFIAFEGAYHGDTFGAMSVAERSTFSAPFDKHLFDCIHIPPPTPGNERASIEALEKALGSGAGVSAFIFEPLVQGVAGMLVHEGKVLERMIECCRDKGVLTIADEVMTGFGRTGKFFAIDHLEHKPDIICISKGITGGSMPLAATVCNDKVFAQFLSEDPTHTFYHGHSYTGNPTACAAGLASLDLLEDETCWEKIRSIESQQKAFIAEIAKDERVEKARQIGVIAALDLRNDQETSYFNDLKVKLSEFYLSKRILLRPLGNTVYILPPYAMTSEDLGLVHDAIRESLNLVKK